MISSLVGCLCKTRGSSEGKRLGTVFDAVFLRSEPSEAAVQQIVFLDELVHHLTLNLLLPAHPQSPLYLSSIPSSRPHSSVSSSLHVALGR